MADRESFPSRPFHLGASILLIALLLAACGGGNGQEGGLWGEGQSSEPGAIPRSGPTGDADVGEDPGKEVPQGDAKVLEARITEPSPDDLLEFLRPSGNVLYLDVQEAIQALEGHRDVRDELREEWEYWGLSEGLGIGIQDLDYIAFGENRGPDDDVFLLGGTDLGDLRDTLEDLGLEEGELMGVEVWLDADEPDNSAAIAFLGMAILIVSGESLEDVLARGAGHYDVAADILGQVAKGTAAEKEIRPLLAGNEGVMGIILSHLAQATEDGYRTPDQKFFFQ